MMETEEKYKVVIVDDERTAIDAFSGIYCCIYRHCVDTDRIYGQQRALAGQFYHGIEHCRHVDAGA